jgi:hypothetical protein
LGLARLQQDVTGLYKPTSPTRCVVLDLDNGVMRD